MDRRTFLAVSSAAALGLVPSVARAELPRIAVPRDINSIILSGFERPGDRGYGAVYVRGQPDGLMAVQSEDSSWWNLQPGPVIWAGWFGALANGSDDTEAIQRAIDFVAGLPTPGTVHFASGSYKVGKVLGRVEIPAHDDGTHPTLPALEPEIVHSMPYCLSLPKGVALKGEGEVRFNGNYRFGFADTNQAICIVFNGIRELRDTHIENIDFHRYFIAICEMGTAIPCNLRFFDIHFQSCAIGFYSKILERCYFDRITARSTGCPIVVGGQWAGRRDIYYEPGGYADKCYFGIIDNIYERVLGQHEANIDNFFDEYFFKTENNDKRAGPAEFGKSTLRAFPYLGICGRAIYIMSRYSRPSCSNVFVLVSHQFSPRAAVWVDRARACSGNSLYLEGVGFADGRDRVGAIGDKITDPYLGPGVRLPAVVRGYSPIIEAQYVVADRLVYEEPRSKHFHFQADLKNIIP